MKKQKLRWMCLLSLLFDDTGSSKQAGAQLELPTWDYNYESHVLLYHPVCLLECRCDIYVCILLTREREHAQV